MKIKTIIAITNPDTYTTKLQQYVIENDNEIVIPEKVIISFFRQWDQEDKYEKCYSLGLVSSIIEN